MPIKVPTTRPAAMIKSMVDKGFLISNWEMGIANLELGILDFGCRIANFGLRIDVRMYSVPCGKLLIACSG